MADYVEEMETMEMVPTTSDDGQKVLSESYDMTPSKNEERMRDALIATGLGVVAGAVGTILFNVFTKKGRETKREEKEYNRLKNEFGIILPREYFKYYEPPVELSEEEKFKPLTVNLEED